MQVTVRIDGLAHGKTQQALDVLVARIAAEVMRRTGSGSGTAAVDGGVGGTGPAPKTGG